MNIIKDNIKRGTAELVVLSMLKEEDLYGYKLGQKIKKLGEGKIFFPEGTLYPTLYRLTDEKYISRYEVKIGKVPHRVFYHMEQKGLEYLEYILKEYLTISEGIFSILSHTGQLESEFQKE